MRVANIDYKKRIIESFLYNTSVYDAMYKHHLYLVNGEGNDRETALHDTLVYIVTIYDVITKTARVLCWTYSCLYCIVYICGEWVIYAEPVTFSQQYCQILACSTQLCMATSISPCLIQILQHKLTLACIYSLVLGITRLFELQPD